MSSALNRTSACYKQIGDLNDVVISYDYHRNHGHPKQAALARLKIESDWKELKKWMKTVSFSSTLLDMHKATVR